MPQIKISELNVSGQLDGTEILAIVKDSQTVKATTQAIADLASGGGGGGGISGTNYIFVQANGTPSQNATELQAAYDSAKTMSPGADNIITIIAAPGYYDFGSNNFVMDTSYINLVSLDGNRSILIKPSERVALYEGTILVTADYVYVKGVDTSKTTGFGGGSFMVATGLSNTVIENCKGAEWSFGSGDPLIVESIQ